MNCYHVPLCWLGKGLPVPSMKLLKPDPFLNFLPSIPKASSLNFPDLSYPGGLNTYGKTCKALKHASCKVVTELMVWRVEGPRNFHRGRFLSVSESHYAIPQKGLLWGVQLGKKCKLSWFSMKFLNVSPSLSSLQAWLYQFLLISQYRGKPLVGIRPMG